MLQRARAEGIVRIEIADLVAVDELGAALSSDRARPQGGGGGRDAGGDALARPRRAGRRAPRRRGLGAGSVLAIGWGRAIRGDPRRRACRAIPGVLVVPATGGMQQHLPHFQVNEFVRLAAEQLGGTPHFVHAPYLPSAATRDAFLADPTIAESIALWDRIDVGRRRHRPAAREERRRRPAPRRRTSRRWSARSAT